MDNTIVSAIVAVWTAIVNWFTTTLGGVQVVFYSAESGLTFLGVCASMAVGIALVCLLVGIVQNFLRLRS